jgi:hypothetical protein
MNTNWTEKDKAVVKNALARAKKCVEETVLKQFRAYSVEKLEELWKLEQEIRAWRRDCETLYVKYEDAEARMADWIRKGWLKLQEIESLSDERLQRIKKKI